MKTYSIILFLTFIYLGGFSQTTSNDSIKLDYSKINSYCIQTDLNPVFELLDVDTSKLSQSDILFKVKFEDRFKYDEDRDILKSNELSSIDSLVNVFKNYWRKSLLDPDYNYDSLLMADLRAFFTKNAILSNDSLDLDSCIHRLVSNEGYYTLALGKVGRLHDLLIWKSQKDTVYTFMIHNEEIVTDVIFLEDFITKGWVEYATINESIGGWAENDALYCLKDSYDIESDWFKISYLAHEGKHFSDYKMFPNLSGYDLEYRAKLTELSLAQETLYPLIKQFINSANYESDNQHPVANYYVINNLSKKIFSSSFEDKMDVWETIDATTINNAAYELLNENNFALQKEGPEIVNYIRNQEP